MDYIFLTGLRGSFVLVAGAVWPESKDTDHPVKSVKNWLFGIGTLMMFIYGILGYQQGGPIFFAFLQGFAVICRILMMLNTPDNIGTPIIVISGLGHAFKMGSTRRDVSLTLGSLLIAIFSYIAGSWVFFWLNVFFTAFCAYYLIKNLRKTA